MQNSIFETLVSVFVPALIGAIIAVITIFIAKIKLGNFQNLVWLTIPGNIVIVYFAVGLIQRVSVGNESLALLILLMPAMLFSLFVLQIFSKYKQPTPYFAEFYEKILIGTLVIAYLVYMGNLICCVK